VISLEGKEKAAACFLIIAVVVVVVLAVAELDDEGFQEKSCRVLLWF
jgi:hypothetical protein